jgi:DNA polymerase III subunit epsilon
MTLSLTRPLIFIDLETTGINPSKDRIVELAFVKAMPNGETIEKRWLVNPGMPIPAQASAIHKIYDEDVKDKPSFKQLANEIYSHIKGCDIAGYNSNKFDVPLLVEEFLRSGVDIDTNDFELLDVQRIFHTMEPRNLTAAYKFYCNAELIDAHSAMADVKATYEILLAQIQRYPNLGTDIQSINKSIGKDKIVDFARRFVYDEKEQIVFNFGKHKGKEVIKVLKEEPQYYDWMQKSDFEEHTKKVLQQIYTKMKLG